MKRRPWGGVLVALIATGCSAPSTRGRDAEPVTVRSTTVLDCADPIATRARPDRGFETVGGAVALQTARSSRTALQVSPTGSPVRAERYFAKTGLLVRTGRRSEITVAPRARGRATVGWGNRGGVRRADRFVVPACPGATRWIGFPGGYDVPAPACVHLRIRVGDAVHRVAVGVGAPCRGQRPPPAPPDQSGSSGTA
jgi:hypothetical protein